MSGGTPSAAAGLAANAQVVSDQLAQLTGSLTYLQEVCSTLNLNQSPAGMDAMVTIAQARSTLAKTGEVMVTMATLLHPLTQFHAEARRQLEQNPGAQPAWLAPALAAAAATLSHS